MKNVSPPRYRDRFAVVSNRIRRGHAGDPSQRDPGGRRHVVVAVVVGTRLPTTSFSASSSTILKARPVVEPRARRVRGTRRTSVINVARFLRRAVAIASSKGERDEGRNDTRSSANHEEIRRPRMRISRSVALLGNLLGNERGDFGYHRLDFSPFKR